jgi:hypothetical protein
VATNDVTSSPFTPTAPGIYRWRAEYSGDANNNPRSEPCNQPNETVVVAPIITSMSSTASPGIVVGSGTISDTATVIGRVDPKSPATISFHLYGPEDPTCSKPPVFESLDLPYPLDGGSVTSAKFVPMMAGTYHWIAFYSGDKTNSQSNGACGEPTETVVVAKATPLINQSSSPDVNLGADLSNAAVVNGLVNPQDNGTVDLYLYGPPNTAGGTLHLANEAVCSGAPVATMLNVPYNSTGAVVATVFRPTVAGTYGWRATYSGDANNNAATSTCNAVNVRAPEPVVLGPVLPETGANEFVAVGIASATTAAGLFLLTLASIRRRRLG